MRSALITQQCKRLVLTASSFALVLSSTPSAESLSACWTYFCRTRVSHARKNSFFRKASDASGRLAQRSLRLSAPPALPDVDATWLVGGKPGSQRMMDEKRDGTAVEANVVAVPPIE